MKTMMAIGSLLLSAAAFAAVPSRGVPAGCDPAVMSEAYWKIWNDDEQARIDADIERNRKADGVFAVDAPEGTEVEFEQLEHDFRFGAHIFNFNQLGRTEYNDAYKASYGRGGIFNQATVAFYWNNYEPTPGKLRANGQLPGIVPTAGWGYDGYGPVWDMVAAYLPDYLRRYRGDSTIADRMRGTVERVLDFYVSTNAVRKGCKRVVKGVVEVGYADHSSYKTYTRRALPNTCYAIGGCDLVGRTAMAEAYRQAARREFYRGDGLWENGSQTSQACALAFGLCADEESRRQTGEKLIEAVRRADDHPDFGIVGSKHVFRELSKLGRTDLAFKMATQRTLPSFLYWKMKGGTTFMEEFDPDKSPSQNHIMFGDVMAWAYQYLAGIRDVEDGYRRFKLAPDCINALDHVTARVETPYGILESAWRRQDDKLTYEFVIPPSCRARVTFGAQTAEYGPGRYALSE